MIDGDTVVLVDGRHVRLVQIDAPEVAEHECHARASTRVLRRLLPSGARVRIVSDPALDRVDRFGRLLRYLVRNGRVVNLQLVRRGAAAPWFYDGDRGRYAARLLVLARRARAERRGLWATCPGTPLDPLHGVDSGR